MGLNFGRALLVGLNEGLGRYDREKTRARLLREKMAMIKMQQQANYWQDLRKMQFQKNLLEQKAQYDMQKNILDVAAKEEARIREMNSPEYQKKLELLDKRVQTEQARADKYRDDTRKKNREDKADNYKQIMNLQKIRDNMYDVVTNSMGEKNKVLKPGYSQDDVDAIGAKISELRQNIAPYVMPDQPFIRGQQNEFAPNLAGDYGNYWIGGQDNGQNNGQTLTNDGQNLASGGQDIGINSGQGGAAIGGAGGTNVREDVVRTLMQRLP